MKIELDFKSVAKDGLPEKSGEYFVVMFNSEVGCTYSMITGYSTKHKAFNTYDSLDTADNAFTDVIAYCEVPQEWFDNLVKEIA